MAWFGLKNEERAEQGEIQTDESLLAAIYANTVVTKEMALQIPTVAGGVDLIAGIIAGTPIKLYRDGATKAEEVRDDPRLKLLNDETGDTLNANEFWHAMVRDYYLGKGGYAYIARVNGRAAGLYYVDESYVAIQRSADRIFKDYNLVVDGRQYMPYDYFKILRNTRDGMEGVPITKESAMLIDVAWNTLSYEANLVKKGGNKRGFLKSTRKLTEAAMAELKKAFSRLYANGNSESVVVLNEGLDFKESSATSVEMQLNENKVTNAEEFAKIFHISPSAMAGTATQADIDSLARLAAIPLMVTIQCALNRDLLREDEKGKLYFAFDTKELLKGDMKTRYDAYKIALDANFMQIDEVRYAEDLEPLGLTWIKLGLNDVLYDPRTKQIYTPNTDKTAMVGSNKKS